MRWTTTGVVQTTPTTLCMHQRTLVIGLPQVSTGVKERGQQHESVGFISTQRVFGRTLQLKNLCCRWARCARAPDAAL